MLHLHGSPAPQVQPSSSSHARSGWFSHTHPIPKHMRQSLSTGLPSYPGDCSPGEDIHSLICDAVSSCRAFRISASRSGPRGSCSACSRADRASSRHFASSVFFSRAIVALRKFQDGTYLNTERIASQVTCKFFAAQNSFLHFPSPYPQPTQGQRSHVSQVPFHSTATGGGPPRFCALLMGRFA
jgi:hypothetical protein